MRYVSGYERKYEASSTADSAEQTTTQDIFMIKILYLQIIKFLSTLFIFEKLYMFFNHRLILLPYA